MKRGPGTHKSASASHISCRAVLFDLDGVLVDSAECIERTWRSWAARHGLDGDAVMRIAHGRFAQETVSLVAPHLDADEELRALVAVEARATDGLHEVSGARALASQIPQDRWAVVTSGVRAVAEHRLRHAGIRVPPVMICGGDVPRGKPDPAGYLAAAAALGIPPADCIVIEDTPVGVEAAKAAGMRAVALPTTHPAVELQAADVVAPALGALRVRLCGHGQARALEIEVQRATPLSRMRE